MAELIPYPFPALVRWVFGELESQDSIFYLPRKKFFTGDTTKDFSVPFHNDWAASPLGPAAGPHSQMAQNIVLAWLTGSRIIELKTVQILDELQIPRPCIDMHNVGYNVEWSQELKLKESLHEYVKAAMLIDMLRASGKLELAPGFDRTHFDMSVGYDLAGIQSEPVASFIRHMMDASAVVEEYRAQIPEAYAHLRDLDFQSELSKTLTLSTFHGCPPDEIEQIIAHLMETYGLHCVIKLNPTLLGEDQVNALLCETMGYTDVQVPTDAFKKDATWPQVQGIVERLGDLADKLGVSLGVKFTNTLIVRNHRDFFSSDEKEMYLSGPPLHVLAMSLVQRFRQRFGDRFPISFSAGIDRNNFADAAALGLVPITVCSDLLKPGGYGRASAYLTTLATRMDKVGATSVEAWILKAYDQAAAALIDCGVGDDTPEHANYLAALADSTRAAQQAMGAELYTRWLSATKLRNTAHYVQVATADTRYALEKNTKVPKKVGSQLVLFDCLTCDKCIPVCPNAANFALKAGPCEIEAQTLSCQDGTWAVTNTTTISLTTKHQIANLADFCNECGNCDVFCPEDGGPYVIKPRFFASLEGFERFADHEGFVVQRQGDQDTIHARFASGTYVVEVTGHDVRYVGADFNVTFRADTPLETIAGEASGPIDLGYYHIANIMRRSILESEVVNAVNALSA